MSADIWLEDTDGTQIVFDLDPDAQLRTLVPMRYPGDITSDNFNLTYNLTPMLRAAGFPGWCDIVDHPATEIAPICRSVSDRLLRDPAKFQAMNPENGWGSYEDAVFVMGGLAKACADHPTATVRGWL